MKLLVYFSFLCVVIKNVSATQSLRSEFNLDTDINDNAEKNLMCFCNLPMCVTTNYLCKTTNRTGGGCFTDVAVTLPVQRAAHGCLDLLDWDKHTQCRNEPSVPRSNEQKMKINSDSSDKDVAEVPVSSSSFLSSPSSLLLCCYDDLCNHVDIPENHIKYNDSVMAAVLAGTRTSDMKPQLIPTHTSNSFYDNNEVWFRAATIAVPICGALILFVLITLAVKIIEDAFRADIEEAKINGKFRSKHGGGILPLYSPVQYNSSTRMSGYPSHGVEDGKEMKNMSEFSNNENTSDTKIPTNKIPLLFNYQHDEMKNEQQQLANLQNYEHNINIVDESRINLKTNKTMYSESNLISDNTKHKLNIIVNNKLKE